MLAILSDHSRIMQKKGMEQNNAKWNQMRWEGLFAPDEKD